MRSTMIKINNTVTSKISNIKKRSIVLLLGYIFYEKRSIVLLLVYIFYEKRPIVLLLVYIFYEKQINSTTVDLYFN